MRISLLVLLTVLVLSGAGVLAWRLNVGQAPVAEVATGAPVKVPSGEMVSYLDTITGTPGQGLTYRFRFVAPGIAKDGGSVTEDEAHSDMQWLCDNFALERISQTGPQPNQVVIVLSDRVTKFGEASPEATSFFEGYRVEDGKCVWELF